MDEGTMEKWTQYFRTVKNSRFLNPIKQNEYHLKNMKNIFPDVPMFSCVVFTNPECSLRIEVEREKDLNIFTLNQVKAFAEWIGKKEKKYDMEEIDAIFCEMSKYAPCVDGVCVNEEVIPFYQYINYMASDFQNTCDSIKESSRKQKMKISIAAVCISIVAIILNWSFAELFIMEANEQVELAQLELAEFSQKFEKAGEYGDLYIDGDFLTITDAHFAASKDFANTVKLSFTLNWNGENYGVSLTNDTRLLVQMKEGVVKEFYLPQSIFKNGSSVVRLGKEKTFYYYAHSKCEIPYIELYNVDLKNVSYIKLTGINLWEYTGGLPKELSTSIEWKVYDSATDKLVDQVD